MTGHRKLEVKLALVVVGALFVGLFLIPRGTSMHAADRHERIPLASDWSHRHMIYSAPHSMGQAMLLQQQARYVQQQFRRRGGRANDGWRNPFRNNRGDDMKRDWAVNLGSGSDGATAVSIGAGEYAAKFSFDVNSPVTTANCPTDFVVYNTSVPSSTVLTATGTVTIGTATITNLPTAGDVITTTGPNGSVTYQFETAVGSCSALDRCVQISAVANSTTATNLKNAITGTCFNTCPGGNGHNDPNMTAVVDGTINRQVDLTASTAGAAGNLTTFASTSGTREAHTGMTNGTNSQASLVAVNNLYEGTCTPTSPTVLWAYNFGTTTSVQTSAVLSFDGTQVAFVQTSTAAGDAILSILRPHAGDGATYSGVTTNAASPGTTTATAATYVTCKSGATSCLLNLTFQGTGTHPDSNSAPFYDYNNDVLYVGDDIGTVHKFINVFKGSPSEQTTGGWPAITDTTTGGGRVLTAPIYDGASGLVIVADARTSNFSSHGGRIYSISSTGTVVESAQLADAPGFQDAPVVDGAAGRIYAFATLDTGGTNTGVFQLPVAFTGTTTAVEATVGTGNTARELFAGDFDQAYYDSETAGSNQTPTGHLYVCGHTNSTPQLYRITITADAMTAGAGTAGPTLSSSTTSCSPITEIDSGTNGFAFVSVAAETTIGVPTHCTVSVGCLMSFDLSATFGTSLPPSAGIAETGGTSGIIIDNLSTGTGAAQVYFSQLTNKVCNSGASSGCAIQASQSGLN